MEQPQATKVEAKSGLSSLVPKSPRARYRNVLSIIVSLLAVLALFTPLYRADVQGRVGLLLLLTAILEIAHGFRRATPSAQRTAWVSGGITLAMGVLLINAPFVAASALVLFLAGWFAIDGVRYLLGAFRRRNQVQTKWVWILAGAGNLLVAGLILAVRGTTLSWTIAIAAALRILGTASNIVLAPVFTAHDSGENAVNSLGLADSPELEAVANRIAQEESARSAIDRGWILALVAVLFAIHLGRMGLDRTFLGIVSPGFAVVGDLFIAMVLAFVVIIPVSVVIRRLTRGVERRAWSWCLAVPREKHAWVRRVIQATLSRRLRRSIRLWQARYSLRAALSRGLQLGLPLAAILAATAPVWGMSWYFNTENWAAGMWNSWAEERTDVWREAMIRAVWDEEKDRDPAQAFAIHPPGIAPDDSFSFLVIGDTGEGDASQHSLRAQFLEVVRRQDVKFVVISSDVVYPTGAMKDYEANFWLPFMGTTKPVYAIPGNHDWYDALDAFVATFFQPDAARAAIRARVAVDKGISSTTNARIEELIGTAERLRKEYGVPTQNQKAPFFQFQTDAFALIAVDTGVARTLDTLEMAWLRAALESARGKTKMAILGHPLYAGGHYQAEGDPSFTALHALLREHDVAIVMAGDTHNLEYYREPRNDGGQPIHHVVNGGGGAYLSFGTALDWPANPAFPDWAFYPSKDLVVKKIEETTPLWKWPAWWWTKQLGAWPSSPEWLSAAFDVNAAPYYQSFIEVRVEPSHGIIRLIPNGVHGRLRWSDLEAAPGIVPAGNHSDDFVEWAVNMNP
ncbi:MAG: metallophosphoesterase [Gemmataceae bacterium]